MKTDPPNIQAGYPRAFQRSGPLWAALWAVLDDRWRSVGDILGKALKAPTVARLFNHGKTADKAREMLALAVEAGILELRDQDWRGSADDAYRIVPAGQWPRVPFDRYGPVYAQPDRRPIWGDDTPPSAADLAAPAKKRAERSALIKARHQGRQDGRRGLAARSR